MYKGTTITNENISSLMTDREFLDLLREAKHPFKKMDDSGFTLQDYVKFVLGERKRLSKDALEIVNKAARGESYSYISQV